MCYAGQNLRDIERDTAARVAPLVAAWDEDRQDAPAAPGVWARVREAVAGWMRKDQRA